MTMTYETNATNARNDQSDQRNGDQRGGHAGRLPEGIQVAETSAYCIGYTHPGLYAEALARADGDPAGVEPDEAWETEDAVSRAEVEQLALTRWREWQEQEVTITVYQRVGYRAFPHPNPELAAAGVTDCAWDDTRALATVTAGQLVPEEE